MNNKGIRDWGLEEGLGARGWGLGIRKKCPLSLRERARVRAIGGKTCPATLSTPLSTNHYPLTTNSRGFTLVEMLVVVAIIGILASLITAAAWRAVITARNGAIKVEISKLDLAVKAFKEKFGDYPPDFHDSAAVTRFMRKAFPNAASYPDLTNTAKYNPFSALGFWLAGPGGKGFSANVQNPFDLPWNASGVPTTFYASRINPFYDFDASRLNQPTAATNPYCYFAPNVTNGAPYVYYRATINNTYDTTAYTSWSPGTWVRPLPYLQNSVYINPKGYQILCAGRDGVYGTGVTYPAGTDYTANQYDDMGNFTDGTMEQAMP